MKPQHSPALAMLPALVLVSLLGGCRATPDHGRVQREWNDTLRELGINPVFPPREDLQVGDVYARRGNPAAIDLFPNNGYVPIDLWVASVDLRKDMKSFYERRSEHAPTIPSATPAGGDHDARPFADVPHVAGGDSFSNATITRLRQVAFPDFMGMSISGGDLRALVPVEALQLAFGTSWSSEHQVLVKIPSAESCGLPAESLIPRILVSEPDANGKLIPKLAPDVVQRTSLPLLHEGQRAWILATPRLAESARETLLADEALWLDIVTEVYYARTIDISIHTREGRGAGAQVQPPAFTAGALGQPARTGGDAAGGVAASDGQGVLSEEDLRALGAATLADRLNQELDKIGDQTMPGGSVRYVSASAGNVAMRRTYAHPIAIGYRSLLVAVDPQTGTILNLGSQSEGQSKATAGHLDDIAGLLKDAMQVWFREAHPAAQYEFKYQISDEGELTFLYEQIGDQQVVGLEDEIRGARDAIVSHLDWSGREGDPRADPVVQQFLASDFSLAAE